MAPSALSITAGTSATTSWSPPRSAVDTTNNDDLLCGKQSYTIVTSNDSSDVALTLPWATISSESLVDGTFTLTADTSVDLTLIANEASVVHTIYIKHVLVEYPTITQYTALVVTINQAICDCSVLAWTIPVSPTSVTVAVAASSSEVLPLPTVDKATPMAAYPAFKKCYDSSNDCAETGFFNWNGVNLADGSALPAFITLSSTGNQVQPILIAPTTGTDAGVYNIQATFVPTNGASQTYTAFFLTITCTVASWTAPAAPTTGLTYNVFDYASTIDISGLAYVQSPACGYDFTSIYSWTGLTGPLA
jgi:hypothetical protein